MMENLVDVAELSNVCSVATVVFCLICMVVYIVRYNTYKLGSFLIYNKMNLLLVCKVNSKGDNIDHVNELGTGTAVE